jgi:hypothetical protein
MAAQFRCWKSIAPRVEEKDILSRKSDAGAFTLSLILREMEAGGKMETGVRYRRSPRQEIPSFALEMAAIVSSCQRNTH